ncbi:MAG: hypothetical protein LUH55_03385 [Bacteroides thetaiotaomicron]|nr:hypothetical protein [Bacteroides thetaiotaomicron]
MLQDVNKSDSDELLSKVNILIEKVDNLTLRDLRTANCILTDILAARVYDNSILNNAQECYLRNIGLPYDGETGGMKNTKIVANSYLGLYIIGLIKEEDELLLRYMLNMFETGERIVRKK